MMSNTISFNIGIIFYLYFSMFNKLIIYRTF